MRWSGLRPSGAAGASVRAAVADKAGRGAFVGIGAAVAATVGVIEVGVADGTGVGAVGAGVPHATTSAASGRISRTFVT